MFPQVKKIANAQQINLFQGYNSFLDQPCLTALTGDASPLGAFQTTIEQKTCTSFEDFLLNIGVDASVSYTGLDFGVNDKMSFAYRQQITEFSVTVVVRATSVATTSVTTAPTLVSGVTTPNGSDVQTFFTGYGDSWVSSVTMGKEYLAIYVFHCQSSEEQISVANQFSGHGGSVSADVTAQMQTASTATNVNVSFDQYLAGINPTSMPAEADVGTWVNTTFISTTMSGNGAVLSYALSPYESIAVLANAFTNIALTREVFSGVPQSGPNVSQVLLSLQQAADACAVIQGLYGVYGYISDTVFSNRSSQIRIDLQSVQNQVRQMGKTPTATYTVPTSTTLPSLGFGIPSLSYVLGPQEMDWGGPNGSPFDDTLDGDASGTFCPAFVENGWHLHGIQVVGGSWTDAITCWYMDLMGNSVAVQHGQNSASKRVQPPSTITAATTSNWLILSSNIKNLAVMWGAYVNQPTFTLANGSVFTYPPSPEHTNNDSTLTLQTGQSLVAFSGRAGAYLDHLTPIILTFSPALWQAP